MTFPDNLVSNCFQVLDLKDTPMSSDIVSEWFLKYNVVENEVINSELYGVGIRSLNPSKSIEGAHLSGPHINYLLSELCKAIVGMTVGYREKVNAKKEHEEDEDEIEDEEEDEEDEDVKQQLENERQQLCVQVPLCFDRWSYFKVIAAVIKKDNKTQMKVLTRTLIDTLVDLYYVTITPGVAELNGHLSSAELMIIHGDSLIIEAMSNVKVDWDMMQCLHVAAIVHRTLKAYSDRGAKMHIVFFFCHEWFWKKSPQKRFVRNIIQNMLMRRAQQRDAPFSCYMFMSYTHEKFYEYVQQYKPEFIMINDGEQMCPITVLGSEYSKSSREAANLLGSPTMTNKNGKEEDVSIEEQNGDALVPSETNEEEIVNENFTDLTMASKTAAITAIDKLKFCSVLGDKEIGKLAFKELHYMTFYFISVYRMQVAYTSRQIYRDNDIWNFVILSSSNNFMPIIAIKDELVKVCKTTGSLIQGMKFSYEYGKNTEANFKKSFEAAVPGMAESRLGCCALISYLILKNKNDEENDEEGDDEEEEDSVPICLTPQQIDLLKVFIMAGACMDYIDLESRQQPVLPCKEISQFLDIICNVGASFYSMKHQSTFATYYDILDGHLIAVLAKALAKTPLKSLISADLCCTINAAWTIATGEAEDITENPLKRLLSLDIQFRTVPAVAPLSENMSNDESRIMDSLMLQKLEQDFKYRTKSTPINNPLIKKEAKMSVYFDPNERFSDENAPYNEKEHQQHEREKEELNPKYRQARLREEALFLQSLQATANSMGVKPVAVGVRSHRIATLEHEKNMNTQAVAFKGVSKKQTTRSEDIIYKNTINAITTSDKSNHERFNRLCEKLDLACTMYTNANNSFAEVDAKRNLMQSISDLEEAKYFGGNQGLDAGLEVSHQEIYNDMRNRNSSLNYDPIDFILKTQVNGFEKLRQVVYENCENCEKIKKLDEEIARLQKNGGKPEQIHELEKQIAAIESFVSVEVYTKEHAERIAAEIYYALSIIYLTIRSSTIVLEMANTLWKEVKLSWSRELDAVALETENKPEKKRELLIKKDWSIPIMLWDKMHNSLKVIEKFSKLPISDRDINAIRAAAANLDLQSSYMSAIDAELRKLTYSIFGNLPASCAPLPALNIQYTSTLFQLVKMGHLLPREVPPDNDYRVNFNPDLWQRDLMDIVDRRGCAVISAPTSSGKTFISYYCLDEVFSKHVSAETNTDEIGLVVYVAPTRALINQALSDIYGRYKNKDYHGKPFNVCGALGGRDYIRNVYNSQVLVTLPGVLESLLLSPHSSTWLNRVKYYIFDEIHTMEDSGNGAIWGRLLTMVRSPFVALSATMGETGELVAWLNRSRERANKYLAYGKLNPNHIVHIVPKEIPIQRWSDIEKHMFMPVTRQAPPEKSIMDVRVDDDLVPVHPMSALRYEVLALKHAFPPDLRIVPRDTLELYNRLFSRLMVTRKKWGVIKEIKKCEEELLVLRAETYFSHKNGLPKLKITQNEARQWELEVKDQLLKWVNLSSKEGIEHIPNCDLSPLKEKDISLFFAEMKNAVVDVLQSFKSDISGRELKIEALAIKGNLSFPDTFDYVSDNLWRLLITLRDKNMLPALVFNFDQTDCDSLAESLVFFLEEAEEKYRNSREFRKYEEQLINERDANEKQKLSNQAAKGKIVIRDDTGKIVNKETNEQVGFVRPDSDFITPEILPQFTYFPSCYNVINDSDFQDLVASKKLSKDSLIYRCLVRGIGIHHANVSGAIRVVTERFYRTKKLPMVIATKSLALGIHSPCRTVVLAGDNISLNVTEFRQMSGRAGRRGIDFLGHVVFLGISSKKVNKLLTSQMFNLRGNALVDATTNLRLMQLYAENQNMEDQKAWCRYAEGYAECAFTEPLFQIGRKLTSDYTSNALSIFKALHSYYAQNDFIRLTTDGTEFQTMLGNLVINMLNIRNNLTMKTSSLLLGSMIAQGFLTGREFNWNSEYFIILLSYICCHRFINNDQCNIPLECHQSVLRDPLRETLKMRGSHMVCLPAPEGVIASCIRLTSAPVIKLFSQWAVGRSASLEKSSLLESYQLPFQIIEENIINIKNNTYDHDTAGAPMMYHPQPLVRSTSDTEKVKKLDEILKQTAAVAKARQPMLALSGHGDNFDSVEDLLHSLREGLFLNLDDIPAIDLINLNTHTGMPVVMNACLYDFYTCGSQVRGGVLTRLYLHLFNKLNASTSYEILLEQFMLVDALFTAMETACTEKFKELASSKTLFHILTTCKQRTATLRAEITNRVIKPRVVKTINKKC